MATMIQIRNVPEHLHRTLKARAALEGQTLSDFLLAEIERSAARPSLKEIRERLARYDSVELSESPADAVRAEREGR